MVYVRMVPCGWGTMLVPFLLHGVVSPHWNGSFLLVFFEVCSLCCVQFYSVLCGVFGVSYV